MLPKVDFPSKEKNIINNCLHAILYLNISTVSLQVFECFKNE